MIVSVCRRYLAHGKIFFMTCFFALQNGDTKRCSQVGTPSCINNERLNVSIPPLDALIIPKAVRDCKTIHNLFANLSDVFLSHIVSQ